MSVLNNAYSYIWENWITGVEMLCKQSFLHISPKPWCSDKSKQVPDNILPPLCHCEIPDATPAREGGVIYLPVCELSSFPSVRMLTGRSYTRKAVRQCAFEDGFVTHLSDWMTCHKHDNRMASHLKQHEIMNEIIIHWKTTGPVGLEEADEKWNIFSNVFNRFIDIWQRHMIGRLLGTWCLISI